jgi:membrane-bound metal-dependent hydrolase YbcI (DUF457 family)
MPQNGFHGLIGLATARALARKVPSPEFFVPGVVLGAMLPDIDMYPTAIAVLLKHTELIYVIHRSATHSLLFILLLGLAGLALVQHRWLLFGLAVGVVTHVTVDIFFWFAGIDLFWPFGHAIDLWNGVKPPPLLINIREAFEPAAFALFLGCLRRITGADLLKWEIGAWLLFGIALVTAYIFRTRSDLQNFVVTTPYLLLLIPFCWSRVWVLRKEITEWALGSPGACPQQGQ